MTKRKDERKELLKTDEFKAALESGISQTKESPTKVIGAVVGAFALLGLVFLVMSYRDTAAKDAAGQVYQIEGPLFAQVDDTRDRFDFSSERQKYEQALAEAEKTIPSLSGGAKQQALLLKAGALAALGRQDEIPAVYEAVLKGELLVPYWRGGPNFGIKSPAQLITASSAVYSIPIASPHPTHCAANQSA